MTIFLPLLICLIGALVYALSSNAKVAELGRIAFFAGLLAFLLIGGPIVVSLMKG
jgi:Na+/phosphate symporter